MLSRAQTRLQLCLITASRTQAARADCAGIERVLIDLETRGKAIRQFGQGLFLSTHCPKAIGDLRAVLRRAELMVRLNPFWKKTPLEVDYAVEAGADILMLPMAENRAQVRRFVQAVKGRARVSLLIETRAALRALDELLSEEGVNEVHVGLNDMRLSLGLDLLFDALVAGAVDQVAEVAARFDLRFGFGGVTSPLIAGLPVSPELVIAEQVRLKSRCAWLGRSFRERIGLDCPIEQLKLHLDAIRKCAQRWERATAAEYIQSRLALKAELDTWRIQRMVGGNKSKSPSTPVSMSW